MKQAFLVKASVMTRVVVDVPDGFDEDDVIPMDIWEKAVKASIPRLIDNLNSDCGSLIEEVVPDFECPYGSGYNEDIAK
jgi:hypothetical protein